ncbi:MAG: amidohydrolase family protein, partial [Rhodobacteraceae bacterium]|nr:amidohydrolase family protein [Paracoccaceae bacterium]
TAAGAWAAHWEDLTGTLKPGMAADVVVLSGDIEATPHEEIAAMSVALTICGGRVTWRG